MRAQCTFLHSLGEGGGGRDGQSCRKDGMGRPWLTSLICTAEPSLREHATTSGHGRHMLCLLYQKADEATQAAKSAWVPHMCTHAWGHATLSPTHWVSWTHTRGYLPNFSGHQTGNAGQGLEAAWTRAPVEEVTAWGAPQSDMSIMHRPMPGIFYNGGNSAACAVVANTGNGLIATWITAKDATRDMRHSCPTLA